MKTHSNYDFPAVVSRLNKYVENRFYVSYSNFGPIDSQIMLNI